MSKIILINCYFGKFPEDFDCFLKSCEKNNTVDFLFFTDDTRSDLPNNVKIINTSFEALKEAIQSKFEFEITLNSPYKLCDYKPAYGCIFEEYINGYDYWGYCDIDMVFGDIRSFLTEEVLETYDKIYQFGHLTLYKNNTVNNRVFMDEGEPFYKGAFQTDVITVFDEVDGVQKKYDQRNLKTYKERDYADITPRHDRFLLSKAYVDIKNDNHKHQIFTYENGKVFRYYLDEKQIKKEEFVYIHIQKRKLPIVEELGDNYFITYKGYIPIVGKVTKYDVKKYNKLRLLPELRVILKHRKWKITRKIKKLRGKA
ncbi:MAG: hypothetical protein J6W35_01680 [Eubacterium sp.]|nr:hypothetical protein [Eubacterium sp.]